MSLQPSNVLKMIWLMVSTWACAAWLHAAEAGGEARPNIVLIMADDN